MPPYDSSDGVISPGAALFSPPNHIHSLCAGPGVFSFLAVDSLLVKLYTGLSQSTGDHIAGGDRSSWKPNLKRVREAADESLAEFFIEGKN